MDASFQPTCSCPSGTGCYPVTTATRATNFYCQYTFCLPDTMYCGNNIGTCCSGECKLQDATSTYETCTAVTTTTTTTTTTTITTTTTASTTTAAIVISIGTTTTT